MTNQRKPISRQLRLDLFRTRSLAPGDLVVSASNRAAVEAVEAWPNWPGGRLALIGPPGSGKSHLALTWAARVGAHSLQPAQSPGQAPAGAPLLIEDADRRAPDEALFHAFNRADIGATILLTGRTPPSTWRASLPDLRSRLNALPIASIGAPDDDILLAVLERLFRERNIRPTIGVPIYILRRMERSVSAAEEIVDQIDHYASEEKREVTVALAREILGGGPENLDLFS